MKRVSLLSLITLLTLTLHAQNKNVKPVENSSTEMPYKMDLTNLSFGNMAYAQKVLMAWKDYDNNTLQNSADLFADDVVGTLPDGTVIKGKDNMLKGAQEHRGMFTSVTSHVNACATMKSSDSPDAEYVTIWGLETDTDKNGMVTKTHYNEIWVFNKEGKVVEFHQMAAKENE
jgi:ketosteroid isomerase-like protein